MKQTFERVITQVGGLCRWNNGSFYASLQPRFYQSGPLDGSAGFGVTASYLFYGVHNKFSRSLATGDIFEKNQEHFRIVRIEAVLLAGTPLYLKGQCVRLEREEI